MADESRWVTLPKSARPGDLLDVEARANGSLVLAKLVKPGRPRVQLVKRGELLLLSSDGALTWEQTRKALQ